MSKSLKNISIVATATVVSRVLGLGRDILVTQVFGVGALASAFVTAFTLPNLFRRLLGEGALTAAFVPTLNEEITRHRRAGAFTLISQVASWLLLVTVILTVIFVAGLSLVVEAGERGTAAGDLSQTAVRWAAGARLAMILFPYMVLVCLAAAFSAALQTLNRFVEPALSPIWLNLAMIGALMGAVYLGWAESDDGRMLWLCAGVLLGGFLQMLVPAITLVREGWKPGLDLRASPQVRAIGRLMVPTLLGSAVYLVNIAVSRFLGLSLNDSAAAMLNLATRLMELPIGVFAVAVSTVIFPLISRSAAEGNWDQLAQTYRKGMRLILMINIPAAAGLALLAEPVIRVLFQRGEFTPEDTQAMIPVLAVCAFGLPFLAFVSLMLRAFYAQKDTVRPMQAALISFVANLGLSLVLMRTLSTTGLALAGTVAVVVQAVYLQWRLAGRRESLRFGFLWPALGRIMVATGVMAAVVAVGWRAMASGLKPGPGTDVLALLVLIPLGGAVYAALLWGLKIEGRDEVAALLTRRLPESRRPADRGTSRR